MKIQNFLREPSELFLRTCHHFVYSLLQELYSLQSFLDNASFSRLIYQSGQKNMLVLFIGQRLQNQEILLKVWKSCNILSNQ